MKKFIYLPMIVAAMFLLTITSCNNNGEIDTQTVEDHAKGSLVVSDAFAYSNDAASGKKFTEECVTVTQTDNVFEITFDSCETDGIIIDGKLRFTLAQEWNSGALISIEFVDFYFDGNLINGTISAGYKVDITDLNLFNGIYFVIKAQNIVMNFSDNTTFKFNSEMNFGLKIDGVLPVFEYYGFSYGTNRFGQEFETNSEAVLFDRACAWPVSGIFTMKIGRTETVIDFDDDGNASCNNIIKVTQGNQTVNITLEPSK